MSLPAIVVPNALWKGVTEMKIVTKKRLVDTHNRGAAKALGRGSGRRRLSRYSSGASCAADSDVGDSVIVTEAFSRLPLYSTLSHRAPENVHKGKESVGLICPARLKASFSTLHFIANFHYKKLWIKQCKNVCSGN